MFFLHIDYRSPCSREREIDTNLLLWPTSHSYLHRYVFLFLFKSEGTARPPSGVEDVRRAPKAGGRAQVRAPHRQVCQGYRAQGTFLVISSHSLSRPCCSRLRVEALAAAHVMYL